MTIKNLLPNLDQRHCHLPMAELESFAERIKTALQEHQLDGASVNEVRTDPMPPEKDPNGCHYDTLTLRSSSFVLSILFNHHGWRTDVIYRKDFSIKPGRYYASAA